MTLSPLLGELGESQALLTQLGMAMDHMHSHAGLIHLDIKPANVLFCPDRWQAPTVNLLFFE